MSCVRKIPLKCFEISRLILFDFLNPILNISRFYEFAKILKAFNKNLFKKNPKKKVLSVSIILIKNAETGNRLVLNFSSITKDSDKFLGGKKIEEKIQERLKMYSFVRK